MWHSLCKGQEGSWAQTSTSLTPLLTFPLDADLVMNSPFWRGHTKENADCYEIRVGQRGKEKMYQHNKIIGWAVVLLERTERGPGPWIVNFFCSKGSKTPNMVEAEDKKKYSHDKNVLFFKVGSSNCYWGMIAHVLFELWNTAKRVVGITRPSASNKNIPTSGREALFNTFAQHLAQWALVFGDITVITVNNTVYGHFLFSTT